jgi:hypothetical protein
MGCKLLGAVKETKIWAGDCAPPELRGASPVVETAAPALVPEPKSPKPLSSSQSAGVAGGLSGCPANHRIGSARGRLDRIKIASCCFRPREGCGTFHCELFEGKPAQSCEHLLYRRRQLLVVIAKPPMEP